MLIRTVCLTHILPPGLFSSLCPNLYLPLKTAVQKLPFFFLLKIALSSEFVQLSTSDKS